VTVEYLVDSDWVIDHFNGVASITEDTVKTHLHAVYRKLQVRSRAELILYCKDKGIV
jgi:hypothetical protein